MRAGKKISLAVGIAVGSAGVLVTTASATPVITLVTGASSPPLGTLTNTGTVLLNGPGEGDFSNTSSTNVLAVQGGSDSYLPSYVRGINSDGGGDSSGILQVSGFNPSSDEEIYALNLDQDGVHLDPGSATVASIIYDINDADNATFYGGAGTQLASAVPANLSGDFPGYDLILTIPNSYFVNTPVAAGSGAAEFDFDFNLDFSGSPDAVSGTITVTDIGVIPEPASIAIIGFLAIPALLSRRRTRPS